MSAACCGRRPIPTWCPMPERRDTMLAEEGTDMLRQPTTALALAITMVIPYVGCVRRPAGEPSPEPMPYYAFDITTAADTAPGFELPKSAPSVLVVETPNPTPFDQKLGLALRQVVSEQGGVLTQDAATCDLVVAIASGTFSAQRQEIKKVSAMSHTYNSGSFSMLGGPNGWTMTNAWTVSEVPLVVTKSVEYAKAEINMYLPTRKTDASGAWSLKHVWSGALQVTSTALHDKPKDCVNVLFQRFGGPDGSQTRTIEVLQ